MSEYGYIYMSSDAAGEISQEVVKSHRLWYESMVKWNDSGSCLGSPIFAPCTVAHIVDRGTMDLVKLLFDLKEYVASPASLYEEPPEELMKDIGDTLKKWESNV